MTSPDTTEEELIHRGWPTLSSSFLLLPPPPHKPLHTGQRGDWSWPYVPPEGRVVLENVRVAGLDVTPGGSVGGPLKEKGRMELEGVYVWGKGKKLGQDAVAGGKGKENRLTS